MDVELDASAEDERLRESLARYLALGPRAPVLREFEEGGYVTIESEFVGGRQRKVCTLTDKGREAFRVAVQAWMEITHCLEASQSMVDGPPSARGPCCA